MILGGFSAVGGVCGVLVAAIVLLLGSEVPTTCHLLLPIRASGAHIIACCEGVLDVCDDWACNIFFSQRIGP